MSCALAEATAAIVRDANRKMAQRIEAVANDCIHTRKKAFVEASAP
jgi:hypothetical protein